MRILEIKNICIKILNNSILFHIYHLSKITPNDKYILTNLTWWNMKIQEHERIISQQNQIEEMHLMVSNEKLNLKCSCDKEILRSLADMRIPCWNGDIFYAIFYLVLLISVRYHFISYINALYYIHFPPSVHNQF